MFSFARGPLQPPHRCSVQQCRHTYTPHRLHSLCCTVLHWLARQSRCSAVIYRETDWFWAWLRGLMRKVAGVAAPRDPPGPCHDAGLNLPVDSSVCASALRGGCLDGCGIMAQHRCSLKPLPSASSLFAEACDYNCHLFISCSRSFSTRIPHTLWHHKNQFVGLAEPGG